MLTPAQMATVTQGRRSVSDKIRALDAAGVPRAEIARFLGKRYQHVRNVLEDDKPAPSSGGDYSRHREGSGAEVREKATGYVGTPLAEPLEVGGLFRLSVGPDGVVRLPRPVLDAFGLRVGGVVVATLEGEAFTLISPAASQRRAMAMVPQWRPGEPLWSDELIAERRAEAAREDQDV